MGVIFGAELAPHLVWKNCGRYRLRNELAEAEGFLDVLDRVLKKYNPNPGMTIADKLRKPHWWRFVYIHIYRSFRGSYFSR